MRFWLENVKKKEKPGRASCWLKNIKMDLKKLAREVVGCMHSPGSRVGEMAISCNHGTKILASTKTSWGIIYWLCKRDFMKLVHSVRSAG
jgi:hypothetical protein